MQVLLQDLKRAGYTGRHLLARMQRTVYLSDWTREHWDQAVFDLEDIRRASQSPPSDIGRTIDAMDTEARYKTIIISWLGSLAARNSSRISAH